MWEIQMCTVRLTLLLQLLFLPFATGEEATFPYKTEEEVGFYIVGIIAESSDRQAVALVKFAKTSKVRAVRVGYLVAKDVTISAISAETIRLRSASGEEYQVTRNRFAARKQERDRSTRSAKAKKEKKEVYESYSEPGFQRDNNKIVMSKDYRQKIIDQDLGKILMDATAEPYFSQGKVRGFKLSQITPDSIYDKSGLKNEDVITAINGQELKSVAFAIRLLKTLKESDNIVVSIQRQGEEMELQLDVR